MFLWRDTVKYRVSMPRCPRWGAEFLYLGRDSSEFQCWETVRWLYGCLFFCAWRFAGGGGLRLMLYAFVFYSVCGLVVMGSFRLLFLRKITIFL